MALPSNLTLKLFQEFHNIDRHAFARLLILGFDPFNSMNVVAFWNYLERIGFRNFVKNLQQSSDTLLLSLAKDAIICIECLCCCTRENFPLVDMEFPAIRKLVGQEISLSYLFKDRENARRMIDDFVESVCQIAFSDIVLLTRSDDKQSSSKSECRTSDNVEFKVGDWTEIESRVDSEDRSLFLTFSRGHPVSYQELHGFIATRFGKCVEAVYMDRKPQPVFACLVLKSISDMSRILGGKKFVKFSINGKQVRARRFVPRTVKQPRLNPRPQQQQVFL